MHQEIARRWDAQRRLDEAVAAIRSGDADRAIALAENFDRNILAGLLALMIGSGLLDYVHKKLTQDPALAQERYAGRTLLHVAAGEGRLPTVESLLLLCAEPTARVRVRHP